MASLDLANLAARRLYERVKGFVDRHDALMPVEGLDDLINSTRAKPFSIEMAVARRDADVAGCLLHSDGGSQFRARKVQRALTRHQMVGSMGQVGSAGDNAAMESFFALLQKNVLDRRTWTPATSSASPSSPGSNAPTTADAADAAWAD